MSVYETVIGLEIHVELGTKSKIFCGCSTEFGRKANENTCPVCIGLPGVMPVLNERVVELAVKAGQVLNCKINKVNKTDRKNYFYPDLPKAYQISQFDMPVCSDGYLELGDEFQNKKVGITRIHIEEDAGKLIHLEDEDVTLIDYNRTGVPLVEIVTEPDIRSAEEAHAFLKKLRNMLVYSEISDCKMEEGSLRCDANISIRNVGTDVLNTKVEIKNMNSFKEVHKALLKEEKRQLELYRYGEEHKIVQETRRWDAGKGRTVTMRTKEDAHDYRYFPEPDLPPMILEEKYIDDIKETIPELPMEKKERFVKDYGLSDKDAEVIIDDKSTADFFEELVLRTKDPKESSNWVITEVLRSLKEYDDIPVTSQQLSELIKEIKSGSISRNAGKKVFDKMCTTDNMPKKVIDELGLKQISSEDELEKIVGGILDKNIEAVEDLKNGKDKAFGFLMGQTMKATKGKANPGVVKKLLEEKIKKM
ncbi:MAG: Asp-tRNA(Asn)/Glu-tRNA(Gln) amidotransferase subunit GatB [Bacillota bacterium]|nr:Asp-tRNA(Asn)/Glu-tRNA(Gln) amidotransferase subunit GatB [Bacillota bacterium]